MTSKHTKANVENQIMANAPSPPPIKKSCFENLCHTIAAEAEPHAIESMNHKKTVE